MNFPSQIFEGFLFWLSVLSFSGAVLWASIFVRKFLLSTHIKQRTGMNPWQGLCRPIAPLTALLASNAERICSPASMLKTRLQLVRAGRNFHFSAAEFIALRWLAGFFAATLLAGFALLVEGNVLIYAGIGWIVGNGLLILKLRDWRTVRIRQVERALPAFLDLLVLCAQGGLNLNGALVQATDKSPPSALRDEIQTVIRDMRAGSSRADALRALAHRLDVTGVIQLCSCVIQAELMGGSPTAALGDLALQMRTNRFQKAEKLAQEAPVKLIGPLVIFIFPVTFIVIFAPLVIDFLGRGAVDIFGK